MRLRLLLDLLVRSHSLSHSSFLSLSVSSRDHTVQEPAPGPAWNPDMTDAPPSLLQWTSKGMRVSRSTLVMSIWVCQCHVSDVEKWRQIYHRRGGTDEREVMGEEREKFGASAKAG